jgi:hypothetical protein
MEGPSACAVEFNNFGRAAQGWRDLVEARLYFARLSQAGLLTSKRDKQWTFYKRDEARISRIKRTIIARI